MLKHIVFTTLITALPAIAMAAPSGVWRSEKSKKGGFMDVQFYECGSGKTCGKMVEAYRYTGEPNPDFPGKGKQLVTNMTSTDGKTYSGGSIVHAKSGMKFKGTMTVKGNSLTIMGCASGGAVCEDIIFTKRLALKASSSEYL